jgi:N-acetylmuramoyl-L-alanine amidase
MVIWPFPGRRRKRSVERIMRPLRERERTATAGAVAPVAGCVILVALCVSVGFAQTRPEVLHVRHGTYPEYTRIVVDLSAPTAYEVRQVGDPERIAINVRSASFQSAATLQLDDPLVRRVRCNALRDRAQVVLDLVQDAPFRHFALPAADGKPDRIVLDVFRSEPEESPQILPPTVAPARPFTVVLDPGHGGLDPGAMRDGVREKDVVMGVAREMARLLEQLPGYRAVLTRHRDCSVSLGRRVGLAEEEHGDLFISIHCNTHPRPATAGMEIYFLSLKAATDRQAHDLANRENAADLVGLASDDRPDEDVLSILMDLRMARVLDQSSKLAEHLLGAVARSGTVEARRVKQARFQVLRTLAMPAVLVELAYLSNRDDRRLLQSRGGQVDLARTLLLGILAYRGDRDGLNLLAAAGGWTRQYRVQRGDTLWDLARRHRTTIARIREENNLRSLQIEAGQLLRLPELD